MFFISLLLFVFGIIIYFLNKRINRCIKFLFVSSSVTTMDFIFRASRPSITPQTAVYLIQMALYAYSRAHRSAHTVDDVFCILPKKVVPNNGLWYVLLRCLHIMYMMYICWMEWWRNVFVIFLWIETKTKQHRQLRQTRITADTNICLYHLWMRFVRFMFIFGLYHQPNCALKCGACRIQTKLSRITRNDWINRMSKNTWFRSNIWRHLRNGYKSADTLNEVIVVFGLYFSYLWFIFILFGHNECLRDEDYLCFWFVVNLSNSFQSKLMNNYLD